MRWMFSRRAGLPVVVRATIRGSTGAMPAYRPPVLSEEELDDIYAYLQSIPKPVDYKSIPLLNQ